MKKLTKIEKELHKQAAETRKELDEENKEDEKNGYIIYLIIIIIIQDLLAEIIETINSRYGINLTDDDKINIDSVKNAIFEDEEVAKYMNGANSEQNKHDYFKKQFDKVILDLLKDRFDFYKKLDENNRLKNIIFDKIYKDYRYNKNT